MQATNVTHEYIENNLTAQDTLESPAKLRFLVVIEQRDALIFRAEVKHSVPKHLSPFDPGGVLKHLKQTIGEDATSHAAENLDYYKEITATLVDADEILLMGHGTGASSAMIHLQEFLAAHHKVISQKIVGALKVDIEALTEGQMLQEARKFFMQHPNLE